MRAFTPGIKSRVLSAFVGSQEMAVLSSTTACAAITSHTTSSSNVNSTGVPGGTSTESHIGSSLADKIHGITEKLQALGHHRTESEISKTRTGKVYLAITLLTAHYLMIAKLLVHYIQQCEIYNVRSSHFF